MSLMLLKMPGEDVSKLVFSIRDELVNGSLLGYLLFFVSTVGWFTHSRWQRKVLSLEIDRVVVERNKVQEQKLGYKLKSSQGRA
jgi:hypothetical protein